MIRLSTEEMEKPWAKEIFEKIKEGYSQDSDYKKKLETNFEERNNIALEFEKSYLDAVKNKNLHTLDPIDDFCGLDKDDMNYFFKERFYLKEKLRGRATSCPICNGILSRRDKTLDHILPKQNFIQYTLLPINLVPMCHSCNSTKSTYRGQSYEETPFHPYFEDIDFKENTIVLFSKDTHNIIPVEIVINPKVLDSPIGKKYSNNYYNIFELYEHYNTYARDNYNQLILTLQNREPKTSLTPEFVRSIIKGSLDNYRLTEAENNKFNEEYVRLIIFEKLYEDFNEHIYETIIYSVTNL